MDLIVGIGEYAISDNENDVLKTFALGSCVAVTAYHPRRKIAGMVHIALPSSSLVSEYAARPCYYAATAIPLLMDQMYLNFGCHKHEMEIKIFGGAKSIRNNDVFNIGEKNINAVMDILRHLNLAYKIAEISGTQSRSLEMDVATGKVKVTRYPIAL